MRFLDELRGAEGERCTVADLRHGTTWTGTVKGVDLHDGKVYVERDNGVTYRVGYSFVTLEGDEKP